VRGVVLKARNSRGKLARLLLGAILLTIGAAIGIRDPGIASHPLTQIACWVGIIFFPLCALVAVRQLFRTGQIMEINPVGLRWRRWSGELIPWGAFERARPMTIQRQRFLALWFRDPGAHHASTLLGRSAAVNRTLNFGDMALTASGLDCSYEEIEAAVRANAPQLFEVRR
jgi:hypothetical protein